MKKHLIVAILLGFLILPWHLWGQSTHFIMLQWTYAQGADLATGFNVYRATVAGGPYVKLNTAPLALAVLSYTDNLGTGGVKYFYVITAIDAAGFESSSLEVSATMLQSPLAPGGASATAH